jgi:hypothetical protein
MQSLPNTATAGWADSSVVQHSAASGQRPAACRRHLLLNPHHSSLNNICYWLIALLLASLAVPRPAGARDVPFSNRNTVGTNFAVAKCVHAADVDGDGDQDILGAAQGANDGPFDVPWKGKGSAQRHDISFSSKARLLGRASRWGLSRADLKQAWAQVIGGIGAREGE